MSRTIDCGEGKHDVCSGSGTQPYLIPQEAGKEFSCECPCHPTTEAQTPIAAKSVWPPVTNSARTLKTSRAVAPPGPTRHYFEGSNG